MSATQPASSVPPNGATSKPSSPTATNTNGSSTPINSSASAHNSTITVFKPSAIGTRDLSSFSESTQEILKRVSAAKNISPGTAEWEKAREKVLREMVVSNNSFATTRGGLGPNKSNNGSRSQDGTSTTTPDISRVMRRGPGRPRGSGKARLGGRGSRSGKRKRDDEDADADGSDASETYSPVSTVTKSGRNVNKPMQFNPAPEQSPTSSNKRRRSYRRNPEMALCAKCQRGHSPDNNMIVFCDGCNAAYHQWCHDPHISREVVDIPEQEWLCSKCQSEKELEAVPIDARVSGEDLAEEEKVKYFSTLSSQTLASLLLRATKLYPSLPVFAPNTRTQLQAHRAHPYSSPAMLTPPTSHPPSNASRPLQQSSTTHAAKRPSSLAATATTTVPSTQQQPLQPENEADEDPYPDYTNAANDPPATYPRPGTGPIKVRPTTDPEDLPWLLDENFEVFSHLYDDGSGNLVPVDPIRRAKEKEAASQSNDDVSSSAQESGKANGVTATNGETKHEDNLEITDNALLETAAAVEEMDTSSLS